ncbi:MAG: secretin N-terminal domain-containing protein, partial [Pseudomonadota bacterium]
FTVNLQAVSVDVAAQSLLGDILGVPYTLDPSASGTVTMATGGPVPRSDLLMIFETALQANGLILVAEGRGFRIKAQDGSAMTAAMRAEGYGFTALPLRHLGANRMLALLDGFAAPEGALRASENDDMLLVRGSAADRGAIQSMVQTLDVDILSKPNAGIAFLQNAPATQVAEDLAAVSANDPQASGWSIQVLQRSNALLVQAHDQGDLQNAIQWIRQLDRTGGAAGADITVYQVQYAKASDLSVLLQATFGEGGASAAAFESPSPPADGNGGGMAAPQGADASITAIAVSGGGETRFTPDDGNNTIIIRGSTPVRQQALQLLAAIDRPPVQVLIDVLLVEVTLNDATAMGVQAYLQSNDAQFIATNGLTTSITPTAPGFNLVLGNGVDAKLIIDSLAQVTKVKVVSAPSISAFENEEAQIKVVEQVPIVTQQVVSTQAADAPVVNSVEYHDAGVILKVTPRVSQTNLVNLKVDQELSAVVRSAAATLTPTLRQRSISTRVAVYDNQTVALGGLISSQGSSDRKALFGLLPSHTGEDKSRTELIVFITPHVVRNQQDAATISAELRARMPQMSGQ